MHVHQLSFVGNRIVIKKMKSVTLVRILVEAVCVLLRANTLWKSMTPSAVTTSASSYGWIVGLTWFFSFNRETNLKEGKLWIQIRLTPLKNWPCVIFCLVWRGGVNEYTRHLSFLFLFLKGGEGKRKRRWKERRERERGLVGGERRGEAKFFMVEENYLDPSFNNVGSISKSTLKIIARIIRTVFKEEEGCDVCVWWYSVYGGTVWVWCCGTECGGTVWGCSVGLRCVWGVWCAGASFSWGYDVWVSCSGEDTVYMGDTVGGTVWEYSVYGVLCRGLGCGGYGVYEWVFCGRYGLWAWCIRGYGVCGYVIFSAVTSSLLDKVSE